LHDTTRTIYLDHNFRILREVRMSLTYQASQPVYTPFEITDYNYVVSASGIDRAVRNPAGNRICMLTRGTLDLPATVTELPALGFAGDATPRTTVRTFDGNSKLAHE